VYLAHWTRRLFEVSALGLASVLHIEINAFLVQQLIISESQLKHSDQVIEDYSKLKVQLDALKKINDHDLIFRISFDPIWKPTKCVCLFRAIAPRFSYSRENKGVDDKSLYFSHLLLNIMSLQGDNSQLLYNILEYLDSFLLKATTLHQKVLFPCFCLVWR
jgi:hypothetical protein